MSGFWSALFNIHGLDRVPFSLKCFYTRASRIRNSRTAHEVDCSPHRVGSLIQYAGGKSDSVGSAHSPSSGLPRSQPIDLPVSFLHSCQLYCLPAHRRKIPGFIRNREFSIPLRPALLVSRILRRLVYICVDIYWVKCARRCVRFVASWKFMWSSIG